MANTIKDGLFNDPTVWDTGVVPTYPNDVAIINHAITIDGDINVGIDDGTSDAITINAGGQLIWNGDVTSTITCWGHFHQVAGGVVNFDGTSDRTKVLTLRLNASSSLTNNKYTLVIEDVQNFITHGYFIKPFAKISQNVTNSSIVYFEDDISSWNVGDILYYDRNTSAIITSINTIDRSVTVDKNLNIEAGYFLGNVYRNINIQPYNYNYYFQISTSTTSSTPLQFTGVKLNNSNHLAVNHYIKLINCVLIGNSVFSSYMKCVGMDDTTFISFDNKWFCNQWYGDINNSIFISGNTYDFWNRNYYFRNSVVQHCRNIVFRTDIASAGNFYFDSCEVLNSVIATRGDNANSENVDIYNTVIGKNSIITLNRVLISNEIRNCNFQNMTIRIVKDGIVKIFSDFDESLMTIKILNNLNKLYISNTDNKHYYYDYYQKATNQSTITYIDQQNQQNEAVEIQSIRAGTFSLSTSMFVKPNSTYSLTFAMMKDSSVSVPPKIEVYDTKGNLVATESMPDTLNTWEIVQPKNVNTGAVDFTTGDGEIGFYEIRFVFTSDTGSEKFWISDSRNTFAYWKEGYISPIAPFPELSPENLADTVKKILDSKLDAIKSKTDKLLFDTNDFVKAISQNPELANLDVEVSTRKAATDIDFTDSDRTKLFSLENYDDSVLQAKVDFLKKIARNKAEIVTNPDKSQTVTIYDDDGVTPLVTFQIDKDKTLRLPI